MNTTSKLAESLFCKKSNLFAYVDDDIARHQWNKKEKEKE
jgi:hypothetical protein